MKIGVEGQKMPEALKRGPLWALERTKELGLSGIFFGGVLDMSPTLDAGFLRALRARADELGLYIETSLGKINPYASAEAPELRSVGDGDIMLGFRRMMESAAAIGCKELLVLPANFKPAYRGRLACDRFRTDVDWADQLAAMQKVLSKLAPAARDLGVHLNIETHDEITSFEIVRIVESVGDDVVGVAFDTANALQRGEHPVFAAKRLAPYVRQTHIKDAYVAHAPGGLDFQFRPCGKGIVDFRAILPILAEANPALTLNLENAASTDDRPRTALQPRQCIEYHDPIWLAGHPDLTVEELAAFEELVHAFEGRVRSGEIPDWETYESRVYGYPSYERQAFGAAEAFRCLNDGAEYLRSLCRDLKLPVE